MDTQLGPLVAAPLYNWKNSVRPRNVYGRYDVDVKGYDVDVKGYDVDVKGYAVDRQEEKCSSLGPTRWLWLRWVLQAMLGVEISAVDAARWEFRCRVTAGEINFPQGIVCGCYMSESSPTPAPGTRDGGFQGVSVGGVGGHLLPPRRVTGGPLPSAAYASRSASDPPDPQTRPRVSPQRGRYGGGDPTGERSSVTFERRRP
eukprot:1184858-Prorocentrum_minimum.AAC.1